ncbi:uncharacterized protein BJ171DRAFT_427815 [Polychytrium aggregatum]|uniref:uncharacterized protein n=1 Tax=Polychytrium aggregatum TaxID=110093 RepID=UPI0022FDECF3|nr:uncharacterized protein BJ171DRAFT_427815 [Polychytrium aggregatum]KAI9199208.1 hypothetical protein BJ171DRAFT_427815 [Polychytrium aggregatum]
MPPPEHSKFKNIFAQPAGAKGLYTSIKVEGTAPTKVKVSMHGLASKSWPSTQVWLIRESASQSNELPVKLGMQPPVSLVHNKPVQEYAFSPYEPSIIASSTKLDGLVRVWKLDSFEPEAEYTPVAIDSAAMYLAGHEKRVDLIKFHPTAGNILATSDSTLKLWEIQEMQDRLCIVCPGESSFQSFSFDYCGDNIVASALDGFIHLYDPRSGADPVKSILSEHVPGKGARVCWLAPDQFFISTGFNKQGVREIALWSIENLSTPVQTCPVTGSGTTVLLPFWDAALPLVYFGSKGEGIRVFELADGALRFLSTLPIEKQLTAIDILPKTICDISKCEVARFTKLGTDNTLDVLSLCVPRVNSDTVFQQDIFPSAAVINREATSTQYFDQNQSIEPTMVDMYAPKVEVDPALPELPPKTIKTSLSRSTTTLRRASTVKSLHASRSPRPSTAESISNSSASLAVSGPAVHMDGFAYKAIRGWFGVTWEKIYLSLKRTKLYISQDADSDPIAQISLGATRRVEAFAVGVVDSGMLLETQDGNIIQLRWDVVEERDAWISCVRGLAKGVRSSLSPSQSGLVPSRSTENTSLGGLHKSSSSILAASAMAPQPVYSTRDGARLLGTLSVYTIESRREAWAARLVMLDQDGLLHIYSDNMKLYLQGASPLESVNLRSVISVRLSQLRIETSAWPSATTADTGSADGSSCSFHINTTKRVLHFKTRNPQEAANWVIQIQKTIVELGLAASDFVADECPEGLVTVQTDLEGHPGGRLWLTVIDGSFYYFSGPWSTTPVYVLAVANIDESWIKEPVAGPQQQVSYEFTLALRDSRYCTHKLSSLADKSYWIGHLLQIKRQSFDLLGRLGVSLDQTLKAELSKAKAGDLFATSDERIQAIDEQKLSKGEQRALIAVMGKIRLVISTVKLSSASLRRHAAYVVDAGSTIYHFGGEQSTRVCRAKAMDIACRIRKDRSNRPTVTLVERDDRQLWAALQRQFGLCFGDDPPSQADCDLDKCSQARIFRVTNSNLRRRRLEIVYEGPAPSKSLLKSDSVYVVQCCNEVLVWFGKGSNSEHRSLAGLVVQKLASQMAESVGSQGQVTVVPAVEGMETVYWREKFVDYEGSLPISMRIDEAKGNVATAIQQAPIDISTLLVPKPPLQTVLDDGQGKISIWRVKDFDKEPVASHLAGQFFTSESYIVLYTYRPKNSGVERCVSYFWQGSQSSITQKGTSALMTIELCQQTGGEVDQIRVVEGKEPLHLFVILGSKLILIRSGRWDNVPSTIAFDVRETFQGVHKAVQVEVNELKFHPDSSVVVIHESKVFYWYGHNVKGSQQSLQPLLDEVVRRARPSSSNLPREIAIDDTAGLPSSLGAVLKSNGHGLGIADLRNSRVLRQARLFSCTSASGSVKASQIYHFVQDDLDTNAVMLLITGSQFYVWFGVTAKAREKTIGIDTIQVGPCAVLSGDTMRKLCLWAPIWVTQAFQEPDEFSSCFHGKDRCAPARLASERHLLALKRPVAEVVAELQQDVFSVDVLLSENVPEHLDKTKLEMYLDDKDFSDLFGIKKADYLKLAGWKRDQVKKAVGFF